MKRTCVICVIYLFSLLGNISIAEDAADSISARKPYCGLYCLYTAMKLAGKELEFGGLVKPEYLGSKKGSSLAELKQAAHDNGMYAETCGQLNTRALKESSHPVILHVKASAASKEYDHYELYLGTEDGKAKLFDFPEPVKLVPFYELAPRWDGAGLIVSAEPIDLSAVFASARRRFIYYIMAGIAFILSLRWAKQFMPMAWVNSSRKLLVLSAGQAMGLGIAALLCGIIYHFAHDEGFLAHANATSSVQQAHIGNFIPKLDKKKTESLLGGDTVIIDARYPLDYQNGHIEGAINIPVNINETDFTAIVKDLDKDAPVVVYCQSAGCPFALKVTKRLQEYGLNDISIFKGGWNEWKQERK